MNRGITDSSKELRKRNFRAEVGVLLGFFVELLIPL